MTERIFNLFVYGNETHVYSIGCCEYQKEGSYDDLTTYLRSRVDCDYRNAKVTSMDQPVEREVFYAMERLGVVTDILTTNGIIEDGAIFCITHVVDGKVRVDEIAEINPSLGLPDYLSIYMTAEGFNFPQLIEDDHFSAIRILWNAKKYISSIKLLFSAIDTWGFIEYGLTKDCAILWLDKYCDLASLNATPQEVWELRHSLLHMTNLDSRRVRNQAVGRLLPAIASPELKTLPSSGDTRRFHVSRFIMITLPAAIEKWLTTYTQEKGKFAQFIHRYDTIVSEARMAEFYMAQLQHSRSGVPN